MANTSDTLNIGSIRLRNEFPIAETQRSRSMDQVNHPAAAAVARARIAAATEHLPLSNVAAVPATPTSDLVIDKTVLAAEQYAAPLVHSRKIPSALIPFLTAAGVFALVLLLFKSPIIISQLEYSLSSHPQPATTSSVLTGTQIIPAQDTITIPKINVHAPVNYEPSTAESAIQTALQTGVVHYANTALPGQIGNVAIFGHSSNDWWEAGNYKFVFVLLDKLSPGDQISLDYNSKRYTYVVTGAQVVDPTAVSVLNPTPTPTLTLITCSPPGTSLRRLVVTAKQTDPDPSTSTQVATTSTAASPSSLTSSTSPGLFDQVVQAWNTIVSGISSLFGASPTTAPTATSSAGVPATANQLPSAK
jgi:LPXTG-site transpeptidase (sortase) family protein